MGDAPQPSEPQAADPAADDGALRESERRLRQALRAASAGVCDWDLRTQQATWDDVVHALLGFRPDEPRSGDAWLARLHPDDRAGVLARIDHVLATPGDDEWAMQFRVVHPDGSIRWVKAIERAERDDAGRVERITGINIDMTERMGTDEDLKRSHAALQERTQELERRSAQLSRLAADLTLAEQRAREQLARTLHDDLQQLLFSTRLRLERLHTHLGALPEPEAALLESARRELDEAIAAARSFAVELFPRALHESGLPAALAWLADWMRQKYGLTVHLSVPPSANPARKDVRTLLFESVRELLFNSVKHAGVDEAAVDVTFGPDGSLRLEVTDHGAGFDPATVLAAPCGPASGLGLVSIRERLALLGGDLEIESAPGQGARFRLVGPAGLLGVGGPAGAPGADGDRRTGGAWPVRILIVDDHAIVREGLREILSERPEFLVVGEAVDGLQAVARVGELQPDVVVMDVSMPVLDGVEATRRIRAQFPDVQVFGLSTQERTDDLHAIERAGAAGYFTKSADAEALIARLRLVPYRRVDRRRA